MGKDKKEKNPADAFRKEQRKKELLKLKKDREVVREVRDLLNDPKKIDEEIAKAQKISDENKLDKSLKDRIKELQRMKDVANTRQLVLAAQGKKSLAEAETITKPSIYQSNTGVWDDPTAEKNAPGVHPHVKSASRVSTEGLPTYARTGEAPLASQMPLPTSVMLPYPPALVPNFYPRGPIMGGVGGIPLPPPRPSGIGMQQSAHAFVMHPPPPPPRGPPGQHPAGLQIPPPPPYVMPMGAPMMAQSYYGVPGQGTPMYAQPQHQQQHMHGAGAGAGPGAPRPWQPPAHQRKPRPTKHQADEVDPLDPAGQGYTERFGTASVARRPPPPPPPHLAAPEAPALALAPAAPTVPVMMIEHTDPATQISPTASQASLEESSGPVNLPQTSALVAPPPPPSTSAASSFGPVLTADDLMRRRMQVPAAEIEPAQEAPVATEASPVGPAMNFGAVLSAEEIMRRRHMVMTDPTPVAAEPSGPAAGPAFPPPGAMYPCYGTVLSAEQLMRRRYQIPEEEENEERQEQEQSAKGPLAAGPSVGFSGANTNYGAVSLSAEELMRRRYEIPQVVVEDVDSDSNSDVDQNSATAVLKRRFQQFETEPLSTLSTGEDERHFDEDDDNDGNDGAVSEDEVRSAGMAADEQDFDPSVYPYPAEDEDEEVDLSPEALGLNMNNLYPARLPASFTALPQPVRPVPVPPPSAAPSAPTVPKSSYGAISFNDYGDDEDEDEQENEEDYYEESAPKIQPYAIPTTAAAVLPPSTQSSTQAISNAAHHPEYPTGGSSGDVSRAIVKGPRIVKTDRALTAFVPNALKKKRLLSSGGTAGSSAPWKTVKASKVEGAKDVSDQKLAGGDALNEDGSRDGDDGEVGDSSRGGVRSEDLHAATSALLRGASGLPTGVGAVPPAFRTGNVVARPAAAPIAFVPAMSSSSTGANMPTAPPAVPSAEEDAFAQFFQEIKELDQSG